MSVYFIGCLHLGHENMAAFRGFNSSEEHDRTLINGINSVVTKRDKLFILGDVTMENPKPYYLLNLIRGAKHVVLGNHDRGQDIPELLKYVDKVCGCLKYKDWMLTHIPTHALDFDYRISKNVHAHIHHNSLNDERYFNVDAARLGYVPLSYGQIMEDSSERPHP